MDRTLAPSWLRSNETDVERALEFDYCYFLDYSIVVIVINIC